MMTTMHHTPILSVALLGCSVALLGCGGDEVAPGHQPAPPPSAPQVMTSLQSACKGNAFLAAGLIKAKQQGASLIIEHEDAVYNCASKVKMTATLSGTSITVREVVTNPGDIANCVCKYDLSVELEGLVSGSYTIQIFDADGKLAGTLQVTLA